MNLIFSAAWLLLYNLSLSLLLLPAGGLWHALAPASFAGMALFVLLLPLALLTGWALLMVLASVYCRLLPPTPSGKFAMFADQGAVLWALNNALPTLYLKWFQSTLFLNEHLRHVMLWAFNTRVPFSAWIPTNAGVSDLRNLTLGQGVVIGEYCKLVASFQPVPGTLIVGQITIGDGVLVGGNSILLGSVEIGDNCVLQGNVTITHHCRIGRNVRIGAKTHIDAGCQIGDNVVIGKCVTLLPGCQIPAGAVIADGTTLSRPASSVTRPMAHTTGADA